MTAYVVGNAIGFLIGVVCPIAAATGTTLAVGGTLGALKVSRICFEKEKACEKGSKMELFFKVSKWALTFFAGIVGTIGSAVAGFGFFGISAIVIGGPINHFFNHQGMFGPDYMGQTGLVCGTIVGLALERFVIKKIAEQVTLFTTSPSVDPNLSPKPV